jgi:hypothetical protein
VAHNYLKQSEQLREMTDAENVNKNALCMYKKKLVGAG